MPNPRLLRPSYILGRALCWAASAAIVCVAFAPAISAIRKSAHSDTAPAVNAFSDWFADNTSSYAANQDSTPADIKLRLKRQPLDAGMLRLLSKKDHLSETALLKIAHRVSRRDLETQLSMIESAIPEERYQDIVRYADQALMANATSESILLPWLVQNVQLFQSKGGIIGYATRPWFASFIKTGLARADLAGEFAALVGATSDARKRAKLENLGDSLLRSFVSFDQLPLVKQYLISTAGDKQAAINPAGFADFTKHDVDGLGPYAWQYRNTADGFLDTDHAGTLQIYVSPGRRIKIAELTTLYAPGSYDLSQHLSSDIKNGGATVQWQISCRGRDSAYSIWSSELSRENVRDQQIEIKIPSQNCEKQQWSLLGIGADAQGQSTAQLSSISLKPSSPR